MKTKLQVAMLAVTTLALMLSAAGVPAIAAAREREYLGIEQRLTPAQLREIGLTAEQVRLLDRYLRESAPAAPAAAAAPQAEAGGSGGEAPRARMLGLDEGPIRSRLRGSVSGWEPGTVFELENGQQWKVLKGRMKLDEPVEAPEILVVPGIAGRWFLQVDEDLPKARVYRID